MIAHTLVTPNISLFVLQHTYALSLHPPYILALRPHHCGAPYVFYSFYLCLHTPTPLQSARDKASALFHSSKGCMLFSSDVTARGMDYPGVTMVLQVVSCGCYSSVTSAMCERY